MPKKKPEKNSVPELAEDKAERLSYEDPDLVPLKLKRAVAAGDLVLHSRGSDTVYRSLKALEKDWKGISDKIIKIVGSSSKEVYERIELGDILSWLQCKGQSGFRCRGRDRGEHKRNLQAEHVTRETAGKLIDPKPSSGLRL